MKSIVLLICIIGLAASSLRAQTGELVIKSDTKGLYLDHKVTPKENFYSIGRLFNVHPKHIAIFNSLDMTKGLSIGQIIRIPLTDTNFNQKTDKGQPVYYVTGNDENLSRVSTNNNNVLKEKLRQWNHLPNDKIAAGSKLVVGFLVSNGTMPVTIANMKKPETIDKNNQGNNDKEVVKNETVNKQGPKKEEVKQEKEEPKKTEEVKPEKEEPKKIEEVIQVKEEVKPQNSTQSYFKPSFEQQIRQQPISKEQTVTSGIFKTASGWSDAKFYLLMNGVEPGTIMKITNPANNRTIYAKLLGEMNGLKQNQGLNIRISNAAASALEIRETDKFIVKLNY